MPKKASELIFESLKGKYFQYLLHPLLIIENLDSIEPSMMGKSEATFSAYSPTLEKHVDIPLGKIHLYLEISEEQFNKIKKMYKKGLEKEIEQEFNKSLFEENKPNLSSIKTP